MIDRIFDGDLKIPYSALRADELIPLTLNAEKSVSLLSLTSEV